MAFLWSIPDCYPRECIGVYLRDRSPDRFIFKRGTRVPEDVPRPCIQFSASPKDLADFDVLESNAMVPLVSTNVAQLLLEMCPVDCQLIDTDVIADGEKLTGYKLVNAVHLVSCVNHQESDCVYVPNADHIMKFNRLRLKPGCLGSHHLARELDYKSYLYVSQRLKEAFDSKGWRYYAFAPPESVHP